MSPDSVPEYDGARAAAPSPVLGGRYRLGAELGRGGMATVYRATDLRLGRDVAVKVFRPDVAEAMDERRVQREIRLLADGKSPNIVSILDAEATDTGGFYLVMELIEGTDLRRLLRPGTRIEPELVRRICADVAAGLHELHRRGTVHRDIKPANVLVPASATKRASGTAAKLSDFGIAVSLDGTRVTSEHLVIGTPAYMSPEQVTGEAVGPASDIYSLGLLLRECLSGEVPFPGSTAESAVARLLRDPEMPVGVSPVLAALLSRMNAPEPERRPTAAEVQAQLDGPLVGRMLLAEVPGVASGTEEPQRSRRGGARRDVTTVVARRRGATASPREVSSVGSPHPPARTSRGAALLAASAALVLAAVVAGVSLVHPAGATTPTPSHSRTAARTPSPTTSTSEPVLSVAAAGRRYMSSVCPANAAAVRVADARKTADLARMRREAIAAADVNRDSISRLQRATWPDAVRANIAMIVGHLQAQVEVYGAIERASTVKQADAPRSPHLDPGVYLGIRRSLHLSTDTVGSCAAFR